MNRCIHVENGLVSQLAGGRSAGWIAVIEIHFILAK